MKKILKYLNLRVIDEFVRLAGQVKPKQALSLKNKNNNYKNQNRNLNQNQKNKNHNEMLI